MIKVHCMKIISTEKEKSHLLTVIIACVKMSYFLVYTLFMQEEMTRFLDDKEKMP